MKSGMASSSSRKLRSSQRSSKQVACINTETTTAATSLQGALSGPLAESPEDRKNMKSNEDASKILGSKDAIDYKEGERRSCSRSKSKTAQAPSTPNYLLEVFKTINKLNNRGLFRAVDEEDDEGNVTNALEVPERDVCYVSGKQKKEIAHIIPHSYGNATDIQIYLMIINALPVITDPMDKSEMTDFGLAKYQVDNLLPLEYDLHKLMDQEAGFFLWPTKRCMRRLIYICEQFWKGKRETNAPFADDFSSKDILAKWTDSDMALPKENEGGEKVKDNGKGKEVKDIWQFDEKVEGMDNNEKEMDGQDEEGDEKKCRNGKGKAKGKGKGKGKAKAKAGKKRKREELDDDAKKEREKIPVFEYEIHFMDSMMTMFHPNLIDGQTEKQFERLSRRVESPCGSSPCKYEPSIEPLLLPLHPLFVILYSWAHLRYKAYHKDESLRKEDKLHIFDAGDYFLNIMECDSADYFFKALNKELYGHPKYDRPNEYLGFNAPVDPAFAASVTPPFPPCPSRAFASCRQIHPKKLKKDQQAAESSGDDDVTEEEAKKEEAVSEVLKGLVRMNLDEFEEAMGTRDVPLAEVYRAVFEDQQLLLKKRREEVVLLYLGFGKVGPKLAHALRHSFFESSTLKEISTCESKLEYLRELTIEVLQDDPYGKLRSWNVQEEFRDVHIPSGSDWPDFHI